MLNKTVMKTLFHNSTKSRNIVKFKFLVEFEFSCLISGGKHSLFSHKRSSTLSIQSTFSTSNKYLHFLLYVAFAVSLVEEENVFYRSWINIYVQSH